MSLQQQLRPLLQQFTNSTGRGNLMVANSTMAKVIEMMAAAIDKPCGCNCAAPAPSALPAIEPASEKRGRGRPKKATP